MRVLIVAGGTGGHFYPGLALARAAIKRQWQVQFVVRKKDYVLPMLEREGIPYACISGAGFSRRNIFKIFGTVIEASKGFVESLQLLRSWKPDVIVAMGGYLSVPAVLAAKCFGLPVVLHEQNTIPGMANRLLATLSDRVILSFPESHPFFKKPCSVLGNPIRESFFSLPGQIEARKKWGLTSLKPVLLIFGGSLGARRLNELVIEAVRTLDARSPLFQALHFTGPNDEGWVRGAYQELGWPHFVSAYCHEMEFAYAACDVALARAGASTITELMAVRKPAVLIPYPFATAAHQDKNAQVLVDAGAGLVFKEQSLSAELLAETLLKLLNDKKMREQMADGFAKIQLDLKSSAGKILDVVQECGVRPKEGS